MPPESPLIKTLSAWAFATPAATVPTPTSATSFDGHGRIGIGILQIEDQLREVFDRIDVVVRRRRDELHAWRGIAEPRDVLIDLVSRQLAAFTRLGALRHLDLQFLGIDQVVAVTPNRAEATCLI